jgi:hypothetical protein
MQAIQTRYIAPTNTKGARIKAWCAAGSKTIGYPYGLTIDLAHYDAAQQLLVQMQWTGVHYGVLVQGDLPNGDYCHVLVKPNGNPSF